MGFLPDSYRESDSGTESGSISLHTLLHGQLDMFHTSCCRNAGRITRDPLRFDPKSHKKSERDDKKTLDRNAKTGLL